MKIKHKFRPILLTGVLMLVGAVMFAPTDVHANTAAQLKTTIESHPHGGTGTLSATVSGKTVTVTGSVSGVTKGMLLHFSPDVKVRWQASYTGTVNEYTPLIAFTVMAGGQLEITGGSIINRGNGRAIIGDGIGKVIVSGGTVFNNGSDAIIHHEGTIEVTGGVVVSLGTTALDAKIADIKGGLVFGVGTIPAGSSWNPRPAIFGRDPVTIGGNAVVVAWDKNAGTTTYEHGSTQHLVTNSGASVTWCQQKIPMPGGYNRTMYGICYAKGTNSGFYVVDGVTVNLPTVSLPVAKTYTLTVNGGTGSGSYRKDGNANIVANVAPAGKVFDKWTSSGGGTFGNAGQSSTTFKMPASATTVTATYKDLPAGMYAINVLANAGGTANADVAYAKKGDRVLLVATPDEGYWFKKWDVVSGGITLTDSKFTMPANNVTVKAIFERDKNVELPDGEPDGVMAEEDELGEAVGTKEENLANETDSGFNWLWIVFGISSVVAIGGGVWLFISKRKERGEKKTEKDKDNDETLNDNSNSKEKKK